MIENDFQFGITKEWLEKFKKSAILARAELNALESEIEELTQQIEEYEEIKGN